MAWIRLEGRGNRSKRRCCVKIRCVWKQTTEWRDGPSVWESFQIMHLTKKQYSEYTKDWIPKVLQIQSKENELIVWLGFLKEEIQVVKKFMKKCSKSLLVNKMKIKISEMWYHPSYMTFTNKIKDNKYYWENRERELLNAIYQNLM